MTTAGFLDEQQHQQQQRPSGGTDAATRAGGCSGGTAHPVAAYHRHQRQDQQASSTIQHNQHPRLTSGANLNDHRHRHQQQHQPKQEHLKMKQVAPNRTTSSMGNNQYDNFIQQHSDIINQRDLQQQTNHSNSNRLPDRLLIINQEYNEHNGEKDIDDKSSDGYDEEDDDDVVDEDDDDSSEARLAVASAEEYAAKIIKLQQACLIPLKEDLADWLNKILKMSSITTENFMDKLDNGVIICRLAKIISLWCEQQLAETEVEEFTANNIHVRRNGRTPDAENYEHTFSKAFVNTNVPLRSTTSQSINCLTSSASATSLNNGALSYQQSCNQFINNLIKMHHTKIWEDAKSRTFYSRDNVCNFIKWSKDFGVNQSVLFESDDLVLHANPRQVVLCLLDVARIAYVKYGFTEAPGLVKFEQEIDRELAIENHYALDKRVHNSEMLLGQDSRRASDKQTNFSSPNKKSSSRARNSLGIGPIDKTDELVMRYCRHKEEEAARQRNEDREIAAATRLSSSEQALSSSTYETEESREDLCPNLIEPSHEMKSPGEENSDISSALNLPDTYDTNSPVSNEEADVDFDDTAIVSSTTLDMSETHNNAKCIADSGRIDSLDSGEGPTESASTGHGSQMPDASDFKKEQPATANAIPVPKKRTNISPSSTSHKTSSTTHSELSSSRSSLLSNQEGSNSTNKYGRPITSDLDGKVMRIAKSYYGKKATKDITRLSEGKYKIADRIVFVRLLKGHRVMVRIGGGWDTLENFLFRHKSDPSQVIDPDNLLPLETKMPFDTSPQVTPTKVSRLPYYRRSNSASSTNLSLSNLSVSNHSFVSGSSPSSRVIDKNVAESLHSSSVERSVRQQIPYLLIHKGRKTNSQTNITSPVQSDARQQQQQQQQTRQPRIPQLAHHNVSGSNLKRPFYYQQQKSTTPHLSIYSQIQRPLASSLAPAVSATNLYPATLTTARFTQSSINNLGSTKLLNNQHQGKAQLIGKQEAIRKFGFSNDSLQANSYKSPSSSSTHYQRLPKLNGLQKASGVGGGVDSGKK